MCNRRSTIKRLLKVSLTLLISLTLMNEPPKTTDASELNKKEQPESTSQEREVEVEPQSEEKAKEVKKESTPPKKKPKPSYPKGCGNYATLIRKHFGASSGIALRVAKAESGCNPLAVGDNYAIRGLHAPSCGLFQIRTLSGRPSCEQLKNPETNVKWAKRLFLASGWQPWSVCKNGMARCY